MALLSIIVPVYNVAPYLKEGLESILNQQVQDIEVICINDGSTDNSLSILNRYASIDSRVQVYSQVNKGLSAARNRGLSIAKGKYVAFFDSDDLVKPIMYNELLRVSELNDLEIAMCGFRTYPNNDSIIPNFKSNEVVDAFNFIRSNKRVHSSNDLCFSWRFLFKRDFLLNKKLTFIDEIRFGEDMVFNLAAIMMAKKIFLIPEPLYIYRVNNPLSIMKKKYNPYMEEGLQLQVLEKKRLIHNHGIDALTPITKDMSEDIVKRYTQMLFNNLRNNPNEPDKLAGVKRILNMPMIREAMKEVGYRNIYSSWKEYAFYLAMKFRCAKLVYRVYGF